MDHFYMSSKHLVIAGQFYSCGSLVFSTNQILTGITLNEPIFIVIVPLRLPLVVFCQEYDLLHSVILFHSRNLFELFLVILEVGILLCV